MLDFIDYTYSKINHEEVDVLILISRCLNRFKFIYPALVSPEGHSSSCDESDDFTLNLDQIVVDANTNESDNVDYGDDIEECLTQYSKTTNEISDHIQNTPDKLVDSVPSEINCVEYCNDIFSDSTSNLEKNISDISDNSNYEELSYEKDYANNTAFQISGRRIVDVSFFFKQLKSLKHKGYDCSFFDLNLISEKKEGLQSAFFFKCAICNVIECVKPV
ncbi:hypothetical protein FQA39_LY08820 [Lamprigera yunnana]|nr:hypothetical protein FQA39_LY08820 [Lamprigera yunnana]